MTTVKRRAWSQPTLIVLVRGTPQESVLAGCKGGSQIFLNNAAANGACIKNSKFGCIEPCPQIDNS